MGGRELARQLAGWPEAGDWTAGAAGLWAVAAAEAAAVDAAGSGSRGLVSSWLPPPLAEAQVGAARAAARRRLLDAGLGLLACGHGGGAGGGNGGGGSLAADAAATSCPVLLIKRCAYGAAAVAGGAAAAAAAAAADAEAGWSVVLPARWVMPFWQALVYQGESGERKTQSCRCKGVLVGPGPQLSLSKPPHQ